MAAKYITPIGTKYGKLTVIQESGKNLRGDYIYTCKCECGEIKVFNGMNLRSGHTKSCGCYSRELLVQRSTIHGHASKGKESITYKCWRGMIDRCHDPKDNRYCDYGAREIVVCDRWRKSFILFLEDMGCKPTNKTIDRIDVNGNYEPSNCRWATHSEQQRNKRNTKFLTFNGVKKSIPEWSEITNIPLSVIHDRFQAKWSVDKILSLPITRIWSSDKSKWYHPSRNH